MNRTVTFALALLAATMCLGAGAASSLALTPAGDQGWYWQMPQPTGDLRELYDVTLASPTQAWAVGTAGLILHSSDAGATWDRQTSGTAAELWTVQFADDHSGWVLGSDVLLRTTDAGVSWDAVTPAGKGLRSLSVVGPDDCWLTTRSGTLLHTSDGGATWKTTTLSSDDALTVEFADAVHGWATGTRHRLWRTQDAGATWTLATTSLPSARRWYSRVSFTDADHGWLQLAGWSTQIWTTGDGGATWRRVLKTNGRSSFSGPLTAVDASHAMLPEQDDPDIPLEATPISYLRRTSDGGATWTRVCVGSTPLDSLAVWGDTLISLGQDGPARSADGGATWTSCISQGAYSFTAAQALGPTDIWATDQNGALLHSDDGLRWREQPHPVRWSTQLQGLSFPDATNGWLVGSRQGGLFDFFPESPALLHTTDGGASWQEETSPLSGPLSAVDFTDVEHGWIASLFGTVARTSNGGTSWTIQGVPEGGEFTAIDFVDVEHGWAAGSYEKQIGAHTYTDAGAVFVTSNGGATWRRQAIPAGSGGVDQVSFLDVSNGWAVGPGGRRAWVAHTVDGGRTWTRLGGFADESISSVRFTDPLHGWLGGYFCVYATSDGGATWQRVADAGLHTIIAAADAQHAWGFGRGTLVATVDGAGDLAAPTTLDDSDWGWHGSPVTVHLWPADVGGSGLARTEYSVDDGASWQTGTAIDFTAPADHSADGTHEVLYRSSDTAGNVEATRLAKVRIDTTRPVCAVPWRTVVNAGSKGILRFKTLDATSGVARATITIRDLRGRLVASLVRRSGNWDQYPRPPYFWIWFKADLRPGTYRVTVTAEDQAGNPQSRAGHNLLHVVRSGAPVQRRPNWEPGLPENFFVTAGPKGESPRALHSVEES